MRQAASAGPERRGGLACELRPAATGLAGSAAHPAPSEPTKDNPPRRSARWPYSGSTGPDQRQPIVAQMGRDGGQAGGSVELGGDQPPSGIERGRAEGRGVLDTKADFFPPLIQFT